MPLGSPCIDGGVTGRRWGESSFWIFDFGFWIAGGCRWDSKRCQAERSSATRDEDGPLPCNGLAGAWSRAI